MNYRVEWQPEAEEQLTELWTRATDRAMITWAAAEIDQRLGRDPLEQGEQRNENIRLVFVPPLTALFRVEPVKQQVFVVSVGWPGRPV